MCNINNNNNNNNNKLSFLFAQNNLKNSNYNIMQMYIIYLVAIFIRWLYCNQALPGPSTSGFSSPYESPWDAGKFITD